jgi:hypothetical protein
VKGRELIGCGARDAIAQAFLGCIETIWRDRGVVVATQAALYPDARSLSHRATCAGLSSRVDSRHPAGMVGRPPRLPVPLFRGDGITTTNVRRCVRVDTHCDGSFVVDLAATSPTCRDRSPHAPCPNWLRHALTVRADHRAPLADRSSEGERPPLLRRRLYRPDRGSPAQRAGADYPDCHRNPHRTHRAG